MPDGSLDPSFGTGGMVRNTGNYIGGLAIQADGRIVTSGIWTDYRLARYLADGSPDWSFADGGRLAFPADGAANGLAIQPDGKIVMVGHQDTWGSEGQFSSYLLAWRFNTDGS